MRSCICGACAASAKMFMHLARALAARVGEVERLAVEVGLVGDVVHRLGDVVDRDDVRVAELRADERDPLAAASARSFWMSLKK